MPIIKCISEILPNEYLDVHLMVSNPGQWIHQMKESGASCFTFHTEALNNDTNKIQGLVEEVKLYGMDVGLCIKPATDVKVVLDVLEICNTTKIDQILIMT